MSTVGDKDAALQHELFGLLSKAKDRGLSADALRNAFEAAYSQLNWRSTDNSNELSTAKMPQKPRRGRHPIDDDREILEMERLTKGMGLTRWAAATEVARAIEGQNNNLKSRVDRLRAKYRTYERSLIVDHIKWCSKLVDDFLWIGKVDNISDTVRKFNTLIHQMLVRAYVLEMDANGRELGEIKVSLPDYLRSLPATIKKTDFIAELKRVKKKVIVSWLQEGYIQVDEKIRSEFDAFF